MVEGRNLQPSVTLNPCTSRNLFSDQSFGIFRAVLSFMVAQRYVSRHLEHRNVGTFQDSGTHLSVSLEHRKFLRCQTLRFQQDSVGVSDPFNIVHRCSKPNIFHRLLISAQSFRQCTRVQSDTADVITRSLIAALCSPIRSLF